MSSSEAKDQEAAVRDVERAFPTPDEELTHPALPSRNSTRPAGDARRQPPSSSHPPLHKASSALCEIRPLTKGFHWHHRCARSHRDGAAAAKIITSGCLLSKSAGVDGAEQQTLIRTIYTNPAGDSVLMNVATWILWPRLCHCAAVAQRCSKCLLICWKRSTLIILLLQQFVKVAPSPLFKSDSAF